MSNQDEGISDEELPEELQPTVDNPLAQDLDPDEAKSREELDVLGGKTPEQDPEQDPGQDPERDEDDAPE